MKKLLKIMISLLAVGAVVYVVVPKGEEQASGMDATQTSEAKAVQTVDAQNGVQIPLDISNTEIDWTCAKNLAGKIINMTGGWNKAFDSKLAGEALVDAASGDLLQLQAEIDVASLWSESKTLTGILRDPAKGFFKIDTHPKATFITTAISKEVPETVALEGATHMIEGNFQLNGIEKSITIPARVGYENGSLKLFSQFRLNRKDYDMVFVGSELMGDDKIFDDVGMTLKVETQASAGVAAAAPGDGDGAGGTAAAFDINALPKRYTETLPETQISFDMVLVPGDPEKGIKPFYMGVHEVTWNEFSPWVFCEDVEDTSQHGKLRAMEVRPSTPYTEYTRGFGVDQFPALGMSRLSASLYAKWCADQTGRHYRLPTEAEWKHAYALGRADKGESISADEADTVAVYYENAENDDIGDWATRQVGSKQPNALGIHDMAGNVCEWVTDTGDERVALGGHFEDEREALGVGRVVEDEMWNMGYPNEPKSIWWFVDARWVGFRLICEAGPEHLQKATAAN